MTPSGPILGVVIPTLDEEERLPGLLSDLARLDAPVRCLVVDGGSADGTLDVAARHGVRVRFEPPGRSRQLNAGARVLGTPWLLFVHADCRLPADARRALTSFLAGDDRARAAHFRFGLDGPGRLWRLIERGQALRQRLGGLAYGDQGLVISRELFVDVGGFPPLPLMEDVEMVRRLHLRRALEELPARLPTSPRRYEARGPVRTWLRNTALISLYLLGVPARTLARAYPTHSRQAPLRPDVLLVFAKAPEPGRVKTRLAADVGAERAARIYERMGRSVVHAVRDGAWRTVVCFSPPDAADRIDHWLGAGAIDLRPQSPGDLGDRMISAFGEAFELADRVCVIGTDAPDVDRSLVARAFRALDGNDAVVGPARDGGYWLLGLRRFSPEVFRNVPWSTPAVLSTTLDRIRRAGLSVHLLPTLTDVDRVEDLPETLRDT